MCSHETNWVGWQPDRTFSIGQHSYLTEEHHHYRTVMLYTETDRNVNKFVKDKFLVVLHQMSFQTIISVVAFKVITDHDGPSLILKFLHRVWKVTRCSCSFLSIYIEFLNIYVFIDVSYLGTCTVEFKCWSIACDISV